MCKIRIFLFLVVLLIVTVNSLCATVSLFLKDVVVIDADVQRLYLADFFDINRVYDLELLDILENVVFGFAPLPGREMILDKSFSIAKIKVYLPDVNIVSSDASAIRVFKLPLSGDSSTDTLSLVFQNYDFSTDSSIVFNQNLLSSTNTFVESSFVEKKIIDSFFELFVSEDDKNFISRDDILLKYVNVLNETYLGNRIEIKINRLNQKEYNCIISFYNGDIFLQNIRVRFQPILLRNLYIAKRNIQYRQYISVDDYQIKEANYFEYSQPIIFENYFENKVARVFIRQGSVIEKSMLNNAPYIKKDQVIMAVIVIGGVTVTSKVIALEDGEIGKVIRVKNLDSSVILRGIVEYGPQLRLLY